LRKLDAAYRREGLQVIGIYHPKPPGRVDIDTVRKAVVGKQFSFPVAVDSNWAALKTLVVVQR
jgi:hypothetical protein